MFNECLIHLFNCTCLNVMCVCSTIYGLIQKIFDHFICFLKWFLSFFVLMFSAYFFFLSLFKHVLFWKKSVRIFVYSFWLLTWAASFGYSFWRLASRESKLWVHTEGFRDSLVTQLATHQSQNAQNQLFKEFFRGKLVLNLSHPL